MVDTMKKQTCIQFRPSYEGFDRKLPLCISFWNLEFAYLPHPFVKYLPSPLKKTPQKTVLDHLFEFHFTNSVKGSPQISPMTDSFSCGSQLYNTIKSTSLFHFCSCFCKFSQFLLPNRKEEEEKKKRRKKSTNYRFHNIKVPRVTFKTLFLLRNPNQYLSDPCFLGRQEQNKGYDYKTFFF